MPLDDMLYLLGDEEGDVNVHCRECWDGGRPIIFYACSGPSPYDRALVVEVKTLSALYAAAVEHVREKHGG